MRIKSPVVLVLLSLIVAGCSDNDNETQVTPLAQAVKAIGGEDALTNMGLLRINASGSRWIDYEGTVPSELTAASTYASTYWYDLATDDLRIDMTRTALFEAFETSPEEIYSAVLVGDVGGLTAQAGFYPPGAMPSQHVGALRQQQRLFNPHVILRSALADTAAAGDGGEEEYNGRPHRILTVVDAGFDLRLFVDSATGLISKLETTENSPLFRDVPIEVRYSDWQESGGVFFAGSVEMYAVEGLMHSELRSSVDVEPTSVPADTFTLPDGALGTEANAGTLAFGRQSHQVVEAFFQILFGYDPGGAIQVSALEPGVLLLGSGSNSVAVVVDDRLVVLEGPSSPAHGTIIVETLQSEFPDLPISHVIQSHHHQDHSAGLRSIAAAGATVVVGPGVKSYFEAVLSAPSTIRPDALSQTDIVTTVEDIAENGSMEFVGASAIVKAYHVGANPHAADMLIPVVDTATARYVFVADLYNAGSGFTVVEGGPESFMAALRDFGLIDASCVSTVNPITIIPSHGVAQSLEDSITEMETLGLDVGCP